MQPDAIASMDRNQIRALARLIIDRDPDFIPVNDDELEKMTQTDLRKIRQAYHEIAYAPPPRR